ncbi:pleurocidin-like peptide WF3 [Haplochromis burtoni]|uniref:Uncharacterized protein n=1 Tax=Haplochromis burtoni TaxID=8153 RepID=A0A3Q3CTR8_HAPBU|nr:pleurocidin-like peptide WF3 [Haplochromis burtoni]
MKSAVIFLVLFMVFMIAEPGECFWDKLLKGVGGFAQGFTGKEKAKELVKSMKADLQNYKQLRQREFD